jgi:hypothetical protein
VKTIKHVERLTQQRLKYTIDHSLHLNKMGDFTFKRGWHITYKAEEEGRFRKARVLEEALW